MPDPTIGQLVAREDRNPEVERLLALIDGSKAQLRSLLVARERQLRFVARLSGTGGWTLQLSPLRFLPSIEWLEMHGWAPDERPTLKMALRHVAASDLPALLAALRRCAAQGQPADLAVTVLHRAGHVVFMRMIGEAVRDESGAVARIEGACQDVTVHVRREQELAAHRDRLEELVEQRTRDLQTFSHALAHDLRAPIAAMAGFAQVIAEQGAQGLSERNRHRLERIVANGHRAEALIDAILGLVSHLQGPLRKRPVDLTALAAAAVDQLRGAHPERHVQVHVQQDMRTHGDPGLLMSVVGNLVNNAWKFTARCAHPRIEVGRDDSGAFYVKDNGVGFDAQHAQNLFQPLQRLHDDKDFSGLGIGLATAFRIVQRHGGRMWADSAPGAGATFWFVLPPADAQD